MKFSHTNIFIFVLLLSVILIIFVDSHTQNQKQNFSQEQQIPAIISEQNNVFENVPLDSQNLQQQSNQNFQPPLDKPKERVTKKYFGLFVSPKNSPVSPERFYGFHTGADLETFFDEQNTDVQIHAVCDGKLLLKQYASGYGGVAVQACELDNQPITVIYGHLNLITIVHEIGQQINKGEILGILGKGYSRETDGERKHLHLGFHKGSSVNILGYVQNKSQLNQWIDPCLYVCQ